MFNNCHALANRLTTTILCILSHYLPLPPHATVTDETGATTQVKVDINPSYDCVSFGTVKQKDTRTPQVKTDMNPSYDCVKFGTARLPVTSTDTIDTNMNYCY